jgi:hypothetical protein
MEGEYVHRTLLGSLEEKMPHGRSRCITEEVTKMDLRDIGLEVVLG